MASITNKYLQSKCITFINKGVLIFQLLTQSLIKTQVHTHTHTQLVFNAGQETEHL